MGEDVRRGSVLSTLFVEKISHFSFKNCRSGGVLYTLLFLLSITACNNLSNTLNRTPANLLNLANPSVGANGGAFLLDNILPSQQGSGTLYDLVGENSQFDTYCLGAYGTCQCEYTYTQPGVGQQTIQGANVYEESNLIRCTNTVPSGITSFSVVIATVNTAGVQTGYTSNSLTVNLNSGSFAGSTSFLDLSSAQSYVQAKRFQCRKHEFITNPMDNSTIDPFQSENTKVIYPFNFYTTNVSNSIQQLQNASVTNQDQSWECSLVPSADHSVQWWANPNVYSQDSCTDAFCASDYYMMDPPASLTSGTVGVTVPNANAKRRASFWLASKAYGVFQTPVTAANSPGTYVAPQTAIIGYAAKPIPSGSTSVCPSIPIPANSKWVKLWNFRATNLTPPQKVTGSTSMSNAQIACWTDSTAGVFLSCDTRQDIGGSTNGTPIDQLSGANVVASRVGILTSGTASACYDILLASSGTGSWASGQEYWRPSNYAFGSPTDFPVALLQQEPWNLYANISATKCKETAGDNIWRAMTSGNTCTVSSVAPNGVGDPTGTYISYGTPEDTSNIISTPLSIDNYTDYLFVVTDPSVNDSSMIASSLTQYIPLTFRSQSDCPGTDPRNTGTAGQCGNSADTVNWGIDTNDVNSNTATATYPLCALQFYQ